MNQFDEVANNVLFKKLFLHVTTLLHNTDVLTLCKKEHELTFQVYMTCIPWQFLFLDVILVNSKTRTHSSVTTIRKSFCRMSVQQFRQ